VVEPCPPERRKPSVAACRAGSAAGRSKRLRGPPTAEACERDRDRRVGIGAPGGVDGKRARPSAGSEPIAHDLLPKPQRVLRPSLVSRPVALGQKRTMRDPDCRQIDDRAQMQGETGATRMVAAGRIDEQHVRRLREGADCGLERRAFPQREQAGLVGTTCFARDDCARDYTPAADHRRRGPGRLALSPAPCWPPFKAGEAAADRGGAIGKAPLLGRRPRKLLLRSNQFLRRAGPASPRSS
jgi:hypothetical protein